MIINRKILFYDDFSFNASIILMPLDVKFDYTYQATILTITELISSAHLFEICEYIFFDRC
jgi:hypothetical protein